MATITITIPNGGVTRVVNGVCGYFGYEPIITPMIGEPFPNPESKAQFAQRMLVVNVKSWVKSFESRQAAEAARDVANADADLIDIS